MSARTPRTSVPRFPGAVRSRLRGAGAAYVVRYTELDGTRGNGTAATRPASSNALELPLHRPGAPDTSHVHFE